MEEGGVRERRNTIMKEIIMVKDISCNEQNLPQNICLLISNMLPEIRSSLQITASMSAVIRYLISNDSIWVNHSTIIRDLLAISDCLRKMWYLHVYTVPSIVNFSLKLLYRLRCWGKGCKSNAVYCIVRDRPSSILHWTNWEMKPGQPPHTRTRWDRESGGPVIWSC